jgi:hypothetical protein
LLFQAAISKFARLRPQPRKLSPEDRDAFEEHFFESEDSFHKLQTYKSMHEELSLSEPLVVTRRAAESRIWGWVVGVGAAGLLLVAGLTVWLRNPAPAHHETAVAVLPAFEAPPLTPPEVKPPEKAIPPKDQPALPAVASLTELMDRRNKLPLDWACPRCVPWDGTRQLPIWGCWTKSACGG